MGLEQNPAYFTEREDPRNRARSISQPRLIVRIEKDLEGDLKKDPNPLLKEELKRSLLEEEISLSPKNMFTPH